MDTAYKIFIASSNELKDDRDDFREFISVQNDSLHRKGIYLELVQWEYFNDSVVPDGKQNEYNNALKTCDMFVSLFYTKVGKYSEEEFDIAYTAFLETGKPNIWVYFKQGFSSINRDILTVFNFQDKLKAIKHYYSSYNNIDDLKNQFKLQLDNFLEKASEKIPELVNANYDQNKIYFCDRKPESQSFENTLSQNDVIQFHLITCHERDMPQFFIKRKKLEFEDSDTSIIDLYVNPTISPDDDYEHMEQAIKFSIKEQWNKNSELKNFKLRPFENVEIPRTIDILTQLNYDFLLITWQIRSIYWKNDNLKAFIGDFYQKYADLNATLATNKKIFLIGVVSYAEDSDMTRVEFDNKIRDLRFGRDVAKIQLKKINLTHIREWLVDTEIEDNPDTQNEILTRNNLNNKEGYFMSELEEPLRRILKES
jgi:hypothetical protein